MAHRTDTIVKAATYRCQAACVWCQRYRATLTWGQGRRESVLPDSISTICHTETNDC